MQQAPHRRERGFTLMEIMIVLTILVLIFTWFGGGLFAKGEKAKASLNKIRMKEIRNSIEQFQLNYNTLPSSLDDLVRCTDRTGPGCVPITDKDKLSDAWGNPFQYSLESGGRSFKIKSLGADGIEGGEGTNYDAFEVGP